MSDWLSWFSDTAGDADNLRDELGGKGLGLRKMTAAQLPTPPGFTLHASLCRQFFQHDRRWPENAKADVAGALQQLQTVTRCEFGSASQPLVVAVRSGAAISMPGMMKTVLDCGRDAANFDAAVAEITSAIEAVFDSWSSDQAQQYRQRRAIDHNLGTAVNVQQMFPAEFAGVLFSRDPMTLRGNEMIVEMVTGGGDQLVSGDVTPDRLVIPRQGLIERNPNDRTPLPTSLFEKLRDYALQIEELLNRPVDIEWAVAGGEIALLQMRPIRTADADARSATESTTASNAIREVVEAETARLRSLAGEPPVAESFWVAHNLQESVALPTEMTWSVLADCMSASGSLGRLYREFGFRPSANEPSQSLVLRIGGRIYADAEQLAAFFWNGLPLGYDRDLVAQNPDAIDGPPTRFRPELADGSFLWNLPANLWGMWRQHARISRCVRDGVSSRWIQKLVSQIDFTAETAKRNAVDLAKLNDGELANEVTTRFEFVKESFWKSLAPGFLGGMILGRLRDRLRLLFHGDEADAWLGRLLSGLEGSGLSRESALAKVAAGEMTESAFLAEFGCHAGEELELANPRWNEDKASFIAAVEQMKQATVQPAERLQAATEKRLADERQFHEHLGEIGGRSQRDEIFRQLAVVQYLLPFRELGKHQWLKTYACLRNAIRQLGERRGLADDAFHLSLSELLANRDDATANIARRNAERTTLAQLNLPRVILASQLDSLPNALTPPTTADTGTQQHAWQGTALSPGRATGVAMVAEIATGQSPPAQPFVLVCPSTDPGWTPLMASAAALVVERGGLLSHGALIAREFGLPAVRLEEARSHIRSGATITVDGGEGTVTLSAH